MTGKPQVCTASGCEGKPVARRLCRKHYQQAWNAGTLAVHTPAPRRKINRTVCPDDHGHGDTTVCYVQHQCRCDPCTDNRVAREAQRRKLKAYGRYDTGLVDVTEVREHVLMLGEFGIGYKRVAELAGFKSSTPVRTILWGRQDPGRVGEMQKRIKRETAEKILAVKPVIENLAPKQPVPALGTHRRVQALVARGWSVSRIGERLGWTPANFWSLMQKGTVGAATHIAVAALYEQLWDQEPPRGEWHEKAAYTRAVNYATRRGWLPPLAWDDIDTDPTPEAEQSEQTKGERVLEDVEWLLESGEPAAQVALAVDRKPDAIAKLAERHGRLDLARAFYGRAAA